MKSITITLLFFSLLYLQPKAQGLRHNLIFSSGQKTLNEQQKAEIRGLAKDLATTNSVTVLPLVYDSARGRLRFGVYAQYQADAIIAYAESIGFEYSGRPQNFPNSYLGWSVSVVLKIPAVPKISPAALNELDALYNPLKPLFKEKPTQIFVLDPNKDNTIIGLEGTKLFFKANSLLCKDSVQIALKEFYSLSDYVKNALPSSSNGRMLETGGTIFIEATEKANSLKKVAVNKAIGVDIDFTLGKNDAEMTIFTKDPRYPEKLNWLGRSKPRYIIKESFQAIETIKDGEGNIVSKKVFNSKEEWDAHQKELKAEQQKKNEEKADAIRKDEIVAASENMMESKLKIFDLGLINCDKFYDEPTLNYTLTADTIPAQYYLVYTDVRGVLMGNASGNNINFNSIPKDKKATLMVISLNNNQAYMYKAILNPLDKSKPQINLLPVTQSKLDQEMAMLK